MPLLLCVFGNFSTAVRISSGGAARCPDAASRPRRSISVLSHPFGEVPMRKIFCAYVALGLFLAGCSASNDAPRTADYASTGAASAPRATELAALPKMGAGDFDREAAPGPTAASAEAYDLLADNGFVNS